STTAVARTLSVSVEMLLPLLVSVLVVLIAAVLTKSTPFAWLGPTVMLTVVWPTWPGGSVPSWSVIRCWARSIVGVITPGIGGELTSNAVGGSVSVMITLWAMPGPALV